MALIYDNFVHLAAHRHAASQEPMPTREEWGAMPLITREYRVWLTIPTWKEALAG